MLCRVKILFSKNKREIAPLEIFRMGFHAENRLDALEQIQDSLENSLLKFIKTSYGIPEESSGMRMDVEEFFIGRIGNNTSDPVTMLSCDMYKLKSIIEEERKESHNGLSH